MVSGSSALLFAILEDLVRKAAVVSGREFLNFGDAYKTHFTVAVASGDVKAFGGRKAIAALPAVTFA